MRIERIGPVAVVHLKVYPEQFERQTGTLVFLGFRGTEVDERVRVQASLDDAGRIERWPMNLAHGGSERLRREILASSRSSSASSASRRPPGARSAATSCASAPRRRASTSTRTRWARPGWSR